MICLRKKGLPVSLDYCTGLLSQHRRTSFGRIFSDARVHLPQDISDLNYTSTYFLTLLNSVYLSTDARSSLFYRNPEMSCNCKSNDIIVKSLLSIPTSCLNVGPWRHCVVKNIPFIYTLVYSRSLCRFKKNAESCLNIRCFQFSRQCAMSRKTCFLLSDLAIVYITNVKVHL